MIVIAVARASAQDADIDLLADRGDWARGTSLFLEVTLNGAPTGQLAHFDQRGGDLYVSAVTLRQLGFALPADSGDPLRLAALPGVVVEYDAERQRISLLAPLQLLDLKSARLNAPQNAVPITTSSPGVLLDYDLYATHGDGLGSIAATTGWRVFAGDAGVVDTGLLLHGHQTRSEGWRGESVRLDSRWQRAFPASMLRLIVGDLVSGGLAWTRSTRLGGVQLVRDFGLQPYRITTPLPMYFGEATLPSAIELYVNGVRQYSGNVPPGPFELTTVPGVNGVGDARIVVTDALGRSRTVEFPFYASHQLLRSGLLDGSIEFGAVRENYGLRSFNYGNDPVGSGSLRYGVSDRFTLEAHAEGTPGLSLAGIGGAMQLGLGGVLAGAVARSAGEGNGGQYSLGYSWTDNRWSIAVDSTRTQGDYRDVAARYGTSPPRVSERALAGLNTAHAGSFGLTYVRLRYRHESASRIAGAYWSFSRGGRWSLNASISRDLERDNGMDVFLGAAISLDSRTNVSAGLERNHDASALVVDAARPAPGDGGFGWRVQGRGGDGPDGGVAEARWIGRHGEFSAGVSAFGGEPFVYGEASAALMWIGGHLFDARRIDDAFAVVSTEGVAGVPVRLENRVIGRTDADGLLLVTRLNAYQRNQLAIDPMDLPANLRIDHVDAIVTPSDRAGTFVRFGIAPVRAASLLLRDRAGRPLALGSIAHGQGGDAVIGYDGVVYLEGLSSHNTLNVDTPAGRCRVEFDLPLDAETIPEIGPLECQDSAP